MSAIIGGPLTGARLLGRGGGHRPGRAAALAFPLGPVGACPAEPVVLVLISDDSASVIGGADSTGRRYEEFGYVVDRLRARCRCDRERVAILHMNRPCSADRPPLPLNRRFGADLHGGLVVPSDGDGASTMGATLGRAEAIAAAEPAARVVLVVCTDWALTDDPDELADRLARFPGEVVAVTLRAQAPARLRDDPRITVVDVPFGAPVGVAGGALFDAMTRHRPGGGR